MDEENIAELYAKLFPYIVKDFPFKEDLKTILLAFNMPNPSIFALDSSPEGFKKAIFLKSIIDSGDDELTKKIKPIIKI